MVSVWEDPRDVEEDTKGEKYEMHFQFVLKGGNLAISHQVGHLTSARECVRHAGEGCVIMGCFLHSCSSHLMRLATINLSFQVWWYIFLCFILASLWRASKKNFMGRERKFGIPSQFLNHTDTCDFRGIWVGFYRFCCFPHNCGRKRRWWSLTVSEAGLPVLQRTLRRQLTCVTHKG